MDGNRIARRPFMHAMDQPNPAFLAVIEMQECVSGKASQIFQFFGE